MFKKVIVLFIFLISTYIFGQDPIYTQFYAVPTLTNPAFAGSMRNTRFGLGYRNQWMGNSSYKLSTFYATADKFIETINSGIGISLLNQNESLTNYNFTQINLAYSYHIKLTDNWAFFPAISIGYGFKQFNFSNLLFADQIDILTGTINPGSNDPFLTNDKAQFFDISAGGVLYGKSTWIGISLKHLTKPDISFSQSEALLLDMFLSVHGGYKWTINPSTFFPEDSFLFVNFNYIKQGIYNRIDFGTQLQLSKFSLGILASAITQKIAIETDSFISINPTIGLQFEKFKLGVSYDYPVGNYSFIRGTGEVTFQYYIRNITNRKRRWQVKY